MEYYIRLCYHSGHETQWNRTATGEAAPTGNPVAKRGKEPVGGSPSIECICKFSVSLVPDISGGGRAGIAATPHSRTPVQAFSSAEECAGESASEGVLGGRISDGVMDIAADCRGNREAVRDPISSQSCLEGSGKSGMELSEAGATCVAKGRGCHRTLGETPVAAYKKRPQDLVPTLYFLMNPVLCSPQASAGRGRRKGELHFCTMSTAMPEYPPSVPSPSPPGKDAYRCISDSAGGISRGWMSGVFSAPSSRISGGMWFCCGTGAQSIDAKKSRDSLDNTAGFIANIFPPMPRNLTLQNTSGIGPIAPSRTAHPKTCVSSPGCCTIRLENCGVPKRSSGRASMPPHCRGEDDPFHYLCNTQ
jgi:hypothetical protein